MSWIQPQWDTFDPEPRYFPNAFVQYPSVQRCAPGNPLACKPYGACGNDGFCRGVFYLDPFQYYPQYERSSRSRRGSQFL